MLRLKTLIGDFYEEERLKGFHATKATYTCPWIMCMLMGARRGMGRQQPRNFEKGGLFKKKTP
jgi:hypothetical protein